MGKKKEGILSYSLTVSISRGDGKVIRSRDLIDLENIIKKIEMSDAGSDLQVDILERGIGSYKKNY